MTDAREAKAEGDAKKLDLSNRKVDAFTRQLNEANPILTDISDAMTEEGRRRETLENLEKEGASAADIAAESAEVDKFKAVKEEGNRRLMVCSKKYMGEMKALREEAAE